MHYPRGSRAKSPYWDFPKGHIEKGEKPIIAAKRELKEETGLVDIYPIKGFKEKIKYFFNFKNEKILKFVVFFLAETKKEKIKISNEHTGYKWLSFEKAYGKLKFLNAKNILRKARMFTLKESRVNKKTGG